MTNFYPLLRLMTLANRQSLRNQPLVSKIPSRGARPLRILLPCIFFAQYACR